jgi:phosphatidylinositol alpha-1,6-mannosyltransferase
VKSVLFVSKPVVPPWNDSSKNLVRDLVLGLERYGGLAFGRSGGPLELGRIRLEPLYAPAGEHFSPALADQAKVALYLLTRAKADLWHFFFAPNPKSSTVARVAGTVRRIPTVQTVCSVPKEDARLDRVLFADRVVVLSAHTESRFLAKGVARERLVRIPPAVPKMALPDQQTRIETRRSFGLPPEAPIVVYPGDLEFGAGARLTLEAHAELPRETELVFACRAKTEHAKTKQGELLSRASALGTAARVTFTGETTRILDLLGAADVVALPSDVAYAKMDYPLVLLEAMILGRPVVVCEGTPAAELAQCGGALAVPAEASALAAVLGRLIAGTEERKALGEAARAVALSDHDPRTMARAYETLYDALT